MTQDAREQPGRAAAVRPQDSVPIAPEKPGTMDLVGFVGRWVLGTVFIYMGLSKALHPEDFLKLVHQYELTTNPFILNSIAAALPWFEAVCGLLLLSGVAVRGTAFVAVLLLVPFTMAIVKRALALAASQGVPFTSVKFDCGCGSGEIVIWQKLIENGLLIVVACLLVAGYGRKWCVRYGLLKEPEMQSTKE